jgi:DNA-directed RNA polymerase specialized sigma24 family protein
LLAGGAPVRPVTWLVGHRVTPSKSVTLPLNGCAPDSKSGPSKPLPKKRGAELERGQWEKVVEAAWPRLVRALTGLAGEPGRAEDALQDAVEAALKPGVIEKIERADAWLYAVAVRRLGRTRLRSRLESALSDLRGTAPAPGLETVATIELLQGLSRRQRELVIARYYLDLSYRDIATHFGVSAGTATATVTRALQKIRARIEANPEELNAWKTGN